MTTTSNQQGNPKRKPVAKASLGLILGAGFGLIMAGNHALGLIFGADAGLIIGAALDRREKNSNKPS